VRPFRRGVRHLHALGVRPVGELLLDETSDLERLLYRLENYGLWTPQQVAELGGRDWVDGLPRSVA
jgi:hypothetical protein